MKITLNRNDIASRLLKDEYASWTVAGAYALADWLLENEEFDGVEQEFDAVAIRCDYREFPSAMDAACDDGWRPSEHGGIVDGEAEALRWLEQNRAVYSFDKGILVMSQF